MARNPRSTIDLTANADPTIDPAEQAMEEITDAIEKETTDEVSVVQAKPEPTKLQPSAPPDQIMAAAASGPTSTPNFTVTDALEIAQTCSLAGRTDLTAAFIEAQVPPAKVRARLLADKADRSPEIASRIAPQGGTPHAQDPAASPDNLMVRVVQSRLSVR